MLSESRPSEIASLTVESGTHLEHNPGALPRTHKICDIRILILGTKFWLILTILVSLESWRRDLSKFSKIKLSRSLNFVKIENSSLGLRTQN